MAKFKAGDFIIGELEFSETESIQNEYGEWEQVTREWKECKVYLVNRVFIDEQKYSFTKGQEMYSLDNGNGFIDARSTAKSIDSKFELCN